MVLMTCAQAVYAQGEKIQITQTFIKKGQLSTFFNYVDDKNSPADSWISSIEGTLGSSELKLNRYIKLQDNKEEAHISVMILLDISKPPGIGDKEKIKSVIHALLLNSLPRTEFALVTFGEDVTLRKDFTKDRIAFKKTIDDLEMKDKCANLYTGLERAAEIYSQKERVPLEKCQILVITDGQEYDENEVSKDRVITKLEEANLSVYTLGISSRKDGSGEQNNIKQLGYFARLAGGLETELGTNDEAPSNVAAHILSHINSSYVALFELTEGEIKDEAYFLNLSIHSDGEIIQAQKAVLRLNTNREGTKKDTPKLDKDTHNGEEKPSHQTKLGIGMLLIIFLCAGIVLTMSILGAARFHQRKKKDKYKIESKTSVSDTSAYQGANKKKEAERQVITENKHTLKGEISVNDKNNIKNENMAKSEHSLFCDEITDKVLVSQGQEVKGQQIRIIKIGGDLRYGETAVNIIDSFVIGRKSEKSDLAVPDDRWLSDVHCKLFLNNDHVYIEDLNSENGTYVNGVPIVSPMKLSEDDIILIGASKYRIIC